MEQTTISLADPTSPLFDTLFERHVQAMHADTPPESIHMLPRTDLVASNIKFLAAVRGGQALAMGAIKDHGDGLGEIKSMHVLSECRGQGLAAQVLAALVAQASQQGLTQLALETGAQASFAAARRLYAKTGFQECAPFAEYRPDPLSVFMMRRL